TVAKHAGKYARRRYQHPVAIKLARSEVAFITDAGCRVAVLAMAVGFPVHQRAGECALVRQHVVADLILTLGRRGGFTRQGFTGGQAQCRQNQRDSHENLLAGACDQSALLRFTSLRKCEPMMAPSSRVLVSQSRPINGVNHPSRMSYREAYANFCCDPSASDRTRSAVTWIVSVEGITPSDSIASIHVRF